MSGDFEEEAETGTIGRTREEGGGSAEQSTSRSNSPDILTREGLRKIGSTLNGARWQADIAALLGYSKSQITRFLNGQRDLNALLGPQLQFVICERMHQLAELMNVEGMPYANSSEVAEFIAKIEELTKKLPGTEPPRHG